MQIRPLHENEQAPYELLLLSDDTIEAINININKGEVFIAEIADKIIAAFILKSEEKYIVEIKNIAVVRELQGQGIGTMLLKYIIRIVRARGFKKLLVGTCDQCFKEIDFYKKSGFEIFSIRKNFFLDNYKDPIYENGIQIKNMVMLLMEF
ncbi:MULTISPECIES: GNAT family N-acetyltransferase [Methylomonas]|uniref:N-acetyltransferase domain-containing protein n=1 Tax=Methylomonas koyamae TaxID=702114 RepID=A0A177NBF3_9GAMM|nr:GNAT family N-acetyltransferase [Methylomonas koyamae]OAI15327.1 hypothetical protein A1355_10545 [Methylomonas koyamae]